MIAQLFIKKRHISHVIFAVFCASTVMILLQQITAESIGPYQYLIGLGAIATCNSYWLLSRSLFRIKKPIASHHLALAIAISLLIFTKQGYLFVSSSGFIAANIDSTTSQVLSELTVLLSSCILVLSFWEGCRGYKRATKQDKWQRLLFLTTFGFALIISKLTKTLAISDPDAQQWVISSLILFVTINTQIIMYWRYRQVEVSEQNKSVKESDLQLAEEVQHLIINEKMFLQANLKVGDIAKNLNLPEYKVSKALRERLNARNFNQFVNQLRINHAQGLLTEPNNKEWSVLVVGLESGFASVGPFTRAFKAQTGFTPNQYRQNHQ
jgi:AraC-like DNA-binding protein